MSEPLPFKPFLEQLPPAPEEQGTNWWSAFGIGHGFSRNNWTGFLSERNFSDTGNWLTFLPLPEGPASFVGTLVFAAFLKKLTETPKGHELIERIVKNYLSTVGDVLEELHKSSVASPYVACLNSYVVVNVYKRLGLMSPNDATQCRAWIDHFLGEMLLTERAGFSLAGLTALVQGSKSKSSGKAKGTSPLEGLGALASLGVKMAVP